MTEPPFQPINRGAITKNTDKKDINQLIQTEWNIINKLQHLAENTQYHKTKAFYYQTLASHVRTLSMLLRLHAQPDQTQDLAILLSQIQTQAKTIAKRLKNKCKTKQKH